MTELISTNPAKGYAEVGRVTVSTQADVDAAVAAARAALPAWKALTPAARGEYFKKFLELYNNEVEAIAELQTNEMGKPLSESMGECGSRGIALELNIDRSVRVLEPQVIDEYDDYQTELHLEPFGVAAAIAPWNYPTSQMFVAIGQTLLAGNTVVFKHSEECPLTSQKIADLLAQAGFPEGVFTCLYGNGEVGAMMVDADIDLIHFTGSSPVGESLYQKAASKFIPAVLEMGGSSPGIVFEDVDIDEVCLSVFAERFSNNGQICCALKRLIVHESIHDAVVEKLAAIAREQVVGDPLAADTTIGSLVAERQVEALERQVADAIAKGANIVVGGNRPEGLDGAYFEPTVITDTTPDMQIIAEEVFGPVLPVISFKTEEEALAIANDTSFGLSAFVYSDNQERGMRVAQALESGQVSVNGCSYFSTNAPFTGYKRSGMGSVKGDNGFYFVTQQKVIARPK